MTKLALLTCDDLTGFVVDDDLLIDAFAKEAPEIKVETVSWSNTEVDWASYNFAIVRTTWDYTKRLTKFLGVMRSIEESGCALLNPYEILNWSSSKTYLKDIEARGIKIIPSLFLGCVDEIKFKETLSSWSGDKFVLKPVVGASADDIKVLDRAALIEEFKTLKNKAEWFIQPFIESVFTGEISCIYFNGKFSHALRKVPKENDFRVQEEHGSEIISYNPTALEMSFTDDVVEALTKDLLYSRVDFLETEDGPRLMELELIEPSFYFRKSPGSPENFVRAFKGLLKV